MKTRKVNRVDRNANKASLIDELVSAVQTQERTITSLVEAIKSGGNKFIDTIKGNKGKKPPIEKRTPVEQVSVKKSQVEVPEEKSNVEYVMEALESIGRPAMTKEIAYRLKNMNSRFKSLSRDKKHFMQIIYTSASNLVKEKKLSRKPVGKRSYEYSLPSWKHGS